MEFDSILSLKLELKSLLELQTSSLEYYHIDGYGGFVHKFDVKKKDFSKSSTATCILSLLATDNWKQGKWNDYTQHLIRELSLPQKWEGAGLDPKNPFTVAFMLEAASGLLSEIPPDAALSEDINDNLSEAEEILIGAIYSNENGSEIGAANLNKYPPTTYLTQLVIRVINQRKKLTSEIKEITSKWAWNQIDHELALVVSNSKTADPLSLAYSVILVSICGSILELTPDQNYILRKALDVFFASQREDGSWPLSRPLFHYPEVGNAYCFEYELLAQLLQEKDLWGLLLKFIPNLAKAISHLRDTSYQFSNGGKGWASGHHPQLKGPESWSTASVYHFLYEVDRMLAEAIRRSVFDYIGSEYIPQSSYSKGAKKTFAQNLIDSDIAYNGENYSVLKVIRKSFVELVDKNQYLVERGKSLPSSVPISAIFYGPPGTAKTSLAKEVASYLGWPYLILDPSHFVRFGMDKIQAETNTIFSMLSMLEKVVVLLDEFDEMVRERTSIQSETLSRFLTTAMLPKLAEINDKRTIVFIVATNHIEQFDFAIRRPGRFDILLQIMPPSSKAKMEKFNWEKLIEKKKKEIGFSMKDSPKESDGFKLLTYAEFGQMMNQIEHAKSLDEIKQIIERSVNQCTLKHEVEKDIAWEKICENQMKYSRIPNPYIIGKERD